MRLLLIEDDAMSRDLWTMMLEHAGHEVAAAESGEAAVERLQRAQFEALEVPDVVLTDLQLPGLSGAALATELRNMLPTRPERHRTLLLAMSASAPRRTVLKEFDGFLQKPFTVEALGLTIASAERRLEEGISNHPPISSGATNDGHAGQAGQVLDEAVFERLRSTMPLERMKELYALCLSDTRARVERMQSVAKMQHADLFRRSAHEIKGACGMIGAVELRELAAALEETGLENGPVEVTLGLDRFIAACERLEAMLGRRWVAS
jgi:CheY-like chemotaxis protein